MFAKPQKLSGSSLLKGKDAKKLRRELEARFALADTDLERVVPVKATGIRRLQFQAPSRLVVFADDTGRDAGPTTTPVAFDLSGKGDLGLTLYALWRAPGLLPRLVVHAPVSEFVLRGADVMLPGVVFSSPDEIAGLVKGQLRAVYARGNPHAFAIGELLVDAEELQRHGKVGRALRLVHVYGDELWRLGPQTAPNEGFPRITGDEGKRAKHVIRAIDAGGVSVDEDDGHGDETAVRDANEADEGQALGVEAVAIELAAAGLVDGKQESDADEGLETKPDVNATPTEETLSPDEMDALFYRTMLQVLRSNRLKDKHLPMLASTFYTTVFLPARPAGATLNVKQSSYKKTSAFLKAMAAKGLFRVTEKAGVQSIAALGPRHPDVTAHELYRTAEDAKLDEGSADGGPRVAPPPGTHAPDVQEFLGLSQALRALVSCHSQASAGAFEHVTGKKYWTTTEVRDLIATYIDVETLVDPRDKKYVRLNAALTDAVFGKKVPPGGYPERLARPDVYSILLGKCTKYHRVSLYPGHEPKMQGGQLRKIEILAEKSKKHNSSTITSIAFYHQFGIDGPTFAKEAQKKWGCSATTQATEDKQRGEEIKIQGQMVNEVLDYLASKYKIATAKYCNVTYGKNIKAKKK